MPTIRNNDSKGSTNIRKTCWRNSCFLTNLSLLTPYGPTYYFVIKPLLPYLAKSFGLKQCAVENGPGQPMEIAATLDGASLTDHLQPLLGGFKMTDKGAVDPVITESYNSVMGNFFKFIKSVQLSLLTWKPPWTSSSSMEHSFPSRPELMMEISKNGTLLAHTSLFCIWCMITTTVKVWQRLVSAGAWGAGVAIFWDVTEWLWRMCMLLKNGRTPLFASFLMISNITVKNMMKFYT